MRSVPQRSTALTFLTLLGSFAAGPFLGLFLGEQLAPDSQVAQMLSVMAFPLAFFGGLVLWLGLGVMAAVLELLASLVRGRLPHPTGDRSDALVPAGYGSFLVLSVLFSVTTGLVAGLLSSTALATALGGYAIVGTGYGLALRSLAHHGYLPFPEPE